VRKAIRLGSTPERGDVAPDGAGYSPDHLILNRSRTSACRPRRTDDQGVVEPRNWTLAWHGLAESATSIARQIPGLGSDQA